MKNKIKQIHKVGFYKELIGLDESKLNEASQMEELWDWCCTEVMKLDNGEDVWKQINKVHNFSLSQSQLSTYDRCLEMIGEDEGVSLEMYREAWQTIRNRLRKELRQAIEEEKGKIK